MTLAVFGLLLAINSGPTRTVWIGNEAGTKIRIECPKGQTTRIVLPESLKKLVSSPAAARMALDIRVEKSRPAGVLLVTPQEHPYTGILNVTGPTVALTIELHTTPSGVSSEVRLQLGGPTDSRTAGVGAQPAAVSTAVPTRNASPSPPPMAPRSEPTALPSVATLSPEASPSVAPSTDDAKVDVGALAKAEVMSIDRREGQPGQRVCVLEDVLRNETHAWFRFRLLGGAEEQLVSVQNGDAVVRAYTMDVAGKDLRIVVQLPKGQMKRSRMALRFASGTVYRFSLNRNTIFNSFFE